MRLMALTALVLLAAVAPLPAAPLPAAKSGLAQIPASAPMVVHFRGIEGTVDRLFAYLKNALPDHANTVNQAIRNFSDGFGGRDFAGLAKDGPHFAAFLEVPKEGMEGMPKVAIVLATTDSKKFLDGFLKEAEKKALKKEAGGYRSTVMDNNGEPMYILERPGYLILTPRKEVAKDMVTRGVGLDTKISPELMEKFLGMDLSVFLSMDVLNKDYADQLKQAKKLALDELQAGAAGGAIDKSQIELVTKAVNAGFQAVEDSKGIIAGLEIRPTAIALHAQSEVRPGTATSKLLGTLKVSKFEDLGKMPAGNMFYSAGEISAPILSALKGVVFGQGIDPDSKAGKAVAAAIDAMLKAKPGTQVQTSKIPVSGISVWTAEDPQALVAAQVKLVEALGVGGAFAGVILKDKPVIKANAHKFKDISFTRVKLTIDGEKIAAQLNEEQLGQLFGAEAVKKCAEEMKKLLGESTEVYLGVAGKQMIQVSAKDWASAEKLLADFYAGKGAIRSLAGYTQIRKDLPATGNLVALVDFPVYLEFLYEVFKPLADGRVTLPPRYPAPAPKGSAGYVGFALSLHKERASADVAISAEAVLVTYKRFVAPFFGVK